MEIKFSRRVVLRMIDGKEKSIQTEISQPYFPAKTEGQEKCFGCEVLFVSGEMEPVECVGKDAMQALGSALRLLDTYLLYMKNNDKGAQLLWSDGSPYDPVKDGTLRPVTWAPPSAESAH